MSPSLSFIQKQGCHSPTFKFILILICFLVVSGNRSLKAQAVNETDSLALVALYNATDGANWTSNTNWLTGPVSTWYGITVEGNRVTEIRLENNALTGSLPTDLGNLSAATWMLLYQNALSGTIPAELGNMTSLEYLYLYENSLSGSIPPELGNLSNLIELNLATNELTGAIPSELGNLSNLSFLILFTNTLSGNIPTELSNLSSLTYLNLANNELEGSIPAGLGSLSQLTELHLENTSISGSIPVELGNLSSLTHLILKQNDLSGSIPAEIGNLSMLVELELSQNLLTGEIPSALGDLANLESLLLAENQLTGSIPIEIGNLSNLSALWLYANQLSGSIPTQIGNLSNLGMLWLAHNQLSGSIPSELGNLTDMYSLWLADNQFTGALPVEIANMTMVTLLSLSENDFTDVPDFSAISSLDDYQIQNNRLGFQPIEDYLAGGSATTFTYNPQKFVDTEENQTANTGDEVTFTTDVSGSANFYQWYKDGNILDGKTGANLLITNVSINDAGVYTCQITSEVVTDLTLTTYDKTLTVTNYNMESDSLALVALYNATDGPNWTNNTNWLTGPVSTWYGITVSAGRVTKIQLGYKSMSGTLPVELGDLKELSVLDLGHNSIGGSIPDELGEMLSLTELHLNSNTLSGNIPSALGDLVDLTYLNLEGNSLTGSIPADLGNLINLTHLSLCINYLSGSIPSELGNLINLTILAFHSCSLSGDIPPELGNLINLELLSLHINSLSGSIPAELGNLTNLAIFYLHSNSLSGSIPTELGNLTSLTDLNLSSNSLSGCIPTELGNLTNLTSLYLHSNDFTDVPDFSAISSLDDYQIQNNRLGFQPIEDYLAGGSATTFTYNPQKFVDTEENQTANTGDEVTLTTDVSGSANLYQWYKDGSILSGETDPNLTLSNITNDDAGVYTCQISSEIVTDLTLTTYNKTLTVTNYNMESDSLALVALYNATNGANWTSNTNWLTGPVSTWYGIVISGERVTEVQLQGNGLIGTIPADLGGLTALTVLFLYDNTLSGTIPVELGSLSNLEYLYLNLNSLSGSIPVELGNLSSLIELILSENELSGDIPAELGNLSNLTYLILFTNSLSGNIPTALSNLSNLIYLNLANNELEGSIPVGLGSLSQLTELHLENTSISGSIPAELGNLTNLTHLILKQNDLSGSIPSEIGNLSLLEELNLSQNLLTGEIPSAIGNLTNLDQLDLSNNTLSGSLPSELGNLTNLRYFYLYTNSLTGSIPAELGNMSSLQSLYLETNNLSGSIPPELGGLTALVTLKLTNNSLTGSIPPELGAIPNLYSLGLHGNALTGTIPQELGNLSNLQYLDLGINALSGSLPPELGNLTNLKSLDLAYNNFTGSIPTEYGALTSLTTLSLVGNSLEGSIPQELGNLIQLEYLYLYENAFSGEIPVELGNLSSLIYLSIAGNALSGSIPSALGDLTNLVELDLSNNTLSGSIPPELGNLTNLTKLFLGDNSLSGSIPTELGSLTNLNGLYLSANSLIGTVPSELSNLYNLQYLYLYDNDFTDLPDLTALSTLGNYYIYSNHIEFQDIEAYLSGGSAVNFLYDPQKEVDTEEYIVANPGSEVIFTTDISGTANQYQWYKDGSLLSGETSPNLVITEITAADAGVYTCEITSTVVTDLTLTTYGKTLEVTDHTIVCGNISEYVTWSTDTVYVNCDVTIMDMGKVTIDPGVRVLFAGAYKIRVEGCLQAAGTATDSIWFSPVDPEEGWRGIEVEATSSSEPTFFNYCVFENGKAGYRSTQAYSGGALFIGSNMMQVSCMSSSFRNNYAEDDGGAIYATDPMVKIDRCSFCNNECLGDGGAVLLGSNTNSITILNSLFANNESGGKGGGAWLDLSVSGSAFYNNTFANNNAEYGGGIYFYESSIDIYNSILYANASTMGGVQVGIETTANIVPNFYYSDIQGGTADFYLNGPTSYEGSTSNLLNVNPDFVNPTTAAGNNYNGYLADYSLEESSSCNNQGDPSTSSSVIGDYDIIGNNRFYGGVIDQGAFEWAEESFFNDAGVEFNSLTNGNAIWLDYDGDEDLDIFYQGESFGQYSSSFYENTGTSFSPTELSINGVTGAQASVCDYNLDNQPDIFIVARHGSAPFSALYQNTGGNFSLVSSTGIVPLQYAGADWADFDNDGDQDLAICGQSEDMALHCYIYKNTEGSFEVYDDLFGMIYSSVSWQDIDNDGDQDLLTIGNNGSGSRFAKLYKNNEGVFAEISSGITGLDYASIDWAEFNEDGYIDLIVTGQASAATTQIYTNNAGNGFVEYSDALPEISEGAARWADFNSDGLIDVFLIGMEGASGYATQGLYLNNGSGFDNTPSGVLPVTVADVRVADANQDGKPDIFVMGTDYDAMSTLYLNEFSTANTPPTAPNGLQYNISGADLLLSWYPGYDAETPVNSLTYNLLLKDVDENIVQSPLAFFSNGYGKIAQNGNNSLALNKTMQCLPSGTYYWTVQTLDQNFSASPFQDMQTFEVPDRIEITTQPIDDEVCENDAASFGLVAAGTDLTYQWQIEIEGWQDLSDDDIYQDTDTDTLKILAADADMYGNMYRCKITCACPDELFSETAMLTVNSLPTAFNVTGGGAYCAGGTGVEIGLDGSEIGVEYTLVLDGTPTTNIVSGTDAAISFGEQTTAGDYTVSAMNTATTCEAEMTGTKSISIDDLPTAFNVTGGGAYCAGGTGVEIGLDGSEIGVEYTLVLDGTPTTNIVAGTDAAISFGEQTTAGDYTVSAMNTSTTCEAEMTGTKSISIDDLPTAFNVTGGGAYCAGGTGVEIGLDGSEIGVEYTLVLDGTPTTNIVSGTGMTISFGEQTTAGDYTVSAMNTSTTCEAEMTGTKSISIDDLPTAFNVTGGGAYCAGSTGVEIGLDGSEIGVEYTLVLDGTPTTNIVAGTDAAISFGEQTAAGDYTVSAMNTSTTCEAEMNGTAGVSIDDLPTAFNVTGGGAYCAGGTGVEIGLDGSEIGVEYTLVLDGTPTTNIVSGTGMTISFGEQTTAGDYTVSAMNTSTTCEAEMTGTKSISIDDLPTAFNVTGGGAYCAGSTGVEIGLDGSEIGVEYTLVLDGTPTTNIVAGTDAAISFGEQTTAGDYTVSAMNTSTTCEAEMTGNATISIDDLPTAFNVTGGGAYCAGGTGVEIGLDGSEIGVEYTLVLDGTPTTNIVAGTDAAISFGEQTAAGDYTVSAMNTSTTCEAEMNGTAGVSIDDLPTAFNVTGGGAYCAGGTGVEIGLDGSETGVEYTLVLDGTPTTNIVAGTDAAISFGEQTTAGDYTVSAMNTSTTCEAEMTGTKSISIDDLPTAFNVTGGGAYCAGGTGVEIGLDGSEIGVEYTLVLDGTPTTNIVSGTGMTISFGEQTTAGDYTVSAMNTSTTCEAEMTGTKSISIDDLPTAFNVTGGGAYCAGSTGVEIGLDGSEIGVEYTLVLDGTPTTNIVAGTDAAISFGEQTAAGDYTVSAMNTSTTCEAEMNGTAGVSIDDLPTAFNVTGGGAYCAGGTGVEIGLDGSEIGVEYTLVLDGTPTTNIVSGTDAAISFGEQTTAGDYTVSAMNTSTTCEAEMTGNATISIDDLPTAFNVTGGGAYCAGGTGVEIGLDGSEIGVEYTLVLDGTPTTNIVSGTDAAISFGEQTTAGDYTVSAMNTSTTCEAEMTGNATISIDDLPTAFNVTGGGAYCAGGTGVEIGLDGSEIGVEYTLVLDGTPTTNIVAGTDAAISFGEQTAAGDYTVSAMNTSTTCEAEMNGTAGVSIDDLPTAFNVTGGGAYCAGGTGVEIGLDGSETGVEYTLVLDGTPTATIVAGTDAAISFGEQTTAGDYTVSAMNTATTCEAEMTGNATISIDDLPTAFNVTGGGAYCAGGIGVEIGLDGSETGVEYTLVLDGTPTSTIVSGTGMAISFGEQTTAGDYTVSAMNTSTTCEAEMTGNATISIDDLPTAYTVTGGGAYCAGGTGVEIGLDGSETGVEYTLVLDGTPTTNIVSGTDAAISFGEQTTAGDYTVSAMNTSTTCEAEMTGNATISIDDLPTAFNVTGGGAYCAGGTGVEIGLDGSEIGVEYTLVLDGTPTTNIVSGTGMAISFGEQTTAGDYTVSAMNTSTTCEAEMTGNATISIDDLPTAFNVTGGGAYCAGGTGVEIGLDGSEIGVEYTLVLDGTPTTNIVSGTDAAISFGEQTTAGDYTVSAMNTSTTCEAEMTGNATISIDDLPTAFNVTGGGAYCAGGTGVEIGLDGSEIGMEYTLVLDGTPTTNIVSGIDAAISFGEQTTAGDYTVSAMNTSTTCEAEMTGNATISIDDLPTAFNVTGGGAYCAGGTGVEIGLDGSETGVEYTMVLDGTPTTNIVSGTDAAISFGEQTTAGDYTVSAMNTSTTCEAEMTGNATISIDDLPTAFNVTGGGAYCAGGTGVEIGLDGSEIGVEYTLVLDGTPTTNIVSGTDAAISFGEQTTAGDYTVSAMNTSTTCEAEMTGNATISIDDLPTAYNITGGGSYCAGGTGVEIGLDGSETGVEYTLVLDGTPTTNIVSGTGMAISFGDQTLVGDYSVSAMTTLSMCEAAMTGLVSVSIDPLPDVSFVGLSVSYCSNDDPVLLTGNQAPEGEFMGDGITDNGDGTAWFDPATAGVGYHNIEYSYTNPNGCSNQQTTTTEVLDIPIVSFTGLSESYCEDQPAVLLTGNFAPEGEFIGDGITDIGDGTAWFDPALAGIGGPYDISYSYTAATTCSATETQQTTVYPLPIVSFSGLFADYCQSAADVLLTGSEAPEGSFSGDGITDHGDGTATLSFVSLAGATDYDITYSYEDANTCTGISIQSYHLNADPQADFSYTDNCSNQLIQFTDASIANATNIVSWDWVFGDGATSTDQNPTHQYASAAIYDVQLTVENDLGCTHTIMQTVEVFEAPTADFIYEANPACVGSDVLFTDQSTAGSGTITTRMWDLGDGNATNGQSFTHIYENAGIFTVQLITITSTGCSDTTEQQITIHALPDADFDVANGCPGEMLSFIDLSSIPEGTISNWDWDFGDGATSTEQNPQHSYTTDGVYNVSLTVTSDFTCSEMITKALTIYPLPTADFIYGTACSGSPLAFTDQSLGNGATIISWQWDFGDGATSDQQNPEHMYLDAGTYEVQLIVTNENNCTDTKVLSVEILPSPQAEYSWEGACGNEAFQFIDESNAAGSSILSWNWDFGDGGFSTDQNPIHIWEGPGSYNVSLSIISENGCSSEILKTVVVHPVPLADYTVQGFCQGSPTIFADQSQGSGVAIVSWQWDFDDGSTSELQNPEHLYAAGGEYNVQLKVVNEEACVDSVTQTVIIAPKPQIELGNDTVVCPGGYYLDAGGNYESYLWNTGATTPGIMIEESGLYKVTVGNGCVASDSVYITLMPELLLMGRITTADEVVNSGVVYLYRYEVSTMSEIIDSVYIDYGGYYEFNGLNPCERFIIMANADPMFYPNTYSTYYDGVAHWEDAVVIDSTFASIDGVISDIDVQLLEYEEMGQGPGYLQGQVFYTDGGAMKGRLDRGEPVKNTDISLEMLATDEKSTLNDVFHTTRRTKTDQTGTYVFDFLPTGVFRIVVEIPGLPLDSMYRLSVTSSDTMFLNLNYYVDTASGIYLTPEPYGVDEFTASLLKLEALPNPSDGRFALHFAEEQAAAVWVDELMIQDLRGRTILQKRIGKGCTQLISEIDLPNAQAGMYVLRLQTAKGQIVYKLIIRN